MQEIDTSEAFATWLAEAARQPAAVQGLDLRDHSTALESQSFAGSMFLGCALGDRVAGHLVNTGAVVLNNDDAFMFAMHRRALYSPDELFEGFDLNDPGAYAKTPDHAIYQQYQALGADRPPSIKVSLAQRLHDHSITDALEEVLDGEKVVAIMGGHAMERAEPMYAAVARIARELTRRGYCMASGGGPGAMEATHLGAYLANFDDDTRLDDALKVLAPRPQGAPEGKEYDDADWLHRAMQVREDLPLPDPIRFHSVGIPTWHYGHEPPAAFATRIAKYFANSVREEGLLAVANHGVVFSPGSAGTTQEIFQDAAQNHYGSYGGRAPMLFFGVDHWTRVRPVWPLLQHVARGRVYDELLFLTDDEDAIVRKILSFDPAIYATS